MRLFAVWLAKVLLVEVENFLVLVRLTLDLVAVFLVDRDLTLADDLHVTVVIWLSAAANTAAWASHDFDRLEVALAGFDALEKLSRVAETVRDADIELKGANLYFSGTDAVETAKLRVSPVSHSYAVRAAASITPPVVPKITDAPVDSPSIWSKSLSGRFAKSMQASFSMRPYSRVVRT